MIFNGRIAQIFQTRTGTKQDGSAWSSQDFVFEYFEKETDRYSDKVVLTIMNDKIRECDLHVNDEVQIGFGHSIREYHGKWYNELRLYHFEKVKAAHGS